MLYFKKVSLCLCVLVLSVSLIGDVTKAETYNKSEVNSIFKYMDLKAISMDKFGMFGYDMPNYNFVFGVKRDAHIMEFKEGFKVTTPLDIGLGKQQFNCVQVANEFKKLPKMLTKNITEIQLLDYKNIYNSYWDKGYKIKNFTSYASGGNNQIYFYANDQVSKDLNNSSLLPTLAHEAGHNLDVTLSTQTDRLSNSKEWDNIMAKDLEFKNGSKLLSTDYGKYCSSYSQSSKSNVEDFADSVSLYLCSKENFVKQFPNRSIEMSAILSSKN